jgi:hypothetical protein
VRAPLERLLEIQPTEIAAVGSSWLLEVSRIVSQALVTFASAVAQDADTFAPIARGTLPTMPFLSLIQMSQ